MIGEKSVKRLSGFLTRCRQQLKNKENLFWVSLQSNMLADLGWVQGDFNNAFQEMTEEMKRNGWILPTLKANMRNQVNIANVQIEDRYGQESNMLSSIVKLTSGTSLIGEAPILFNLREYDWDEKKDEVFKHCIELMSQKNDKNIVVLWNRSRFKYIADTIKRVIKDKEVVLIHPNKAKMMEYQISSNLLRKVVGF